MRSAYGLLPVLAPQVTPRVGGGGASLGTGGYVAIQSQNGGQGQGTIWVNFGIDALNAGAFLLDWDTPPSNNLLFFPRGVPMIPTVGISGQQTPTIQFTWSGLTNAYRGTLFVMDYEWTREQ